MTLAEKRHQPCSLLTSLLPTEYCLETFSVDLMLLWQNLQSVIISIFILREMSLLSVYIVSSFLGNQSNPILHHIQSLSPADIKHTSFTLPKISVTYANSAF